MLTELLTGWITHQRWFAGKGRPIDDLTVESDVELAHGLRRQREEHDRDECIYQGNEIEFRNPEFSELGRPSRGSCLPSATHGRAPPAASAT